MAYAKVHNNYGLQRLAQDETKGVTENNINLVAI
ncbi:hypothetical protein RCIP0095_00020 [Klebsiella phage RCIP0095]